MYTTYILFKNTCILNLLINFLVIRQKKSVLFLYKTTFNEMGAASIPPILPYGEQGWRSGESARLPPVCPGFDSCGFDSCDSCVICGLSLLLVLYSAPRGFSPGTPVFPSPQKPTFPNSNSVGIIVKHFIMSLWLGWLRKHSLCLRLNLHFYIFFFPWAWRINFQWKSFRYQNVPALEFLKWLTVLRLERSVRMLVTRSAHE